MFFRYVAQMDYAAMPGLAIKLAAMFTTPLEAGMVRRLRDFGVGAAFRSLGRNQ